MFSVRGGGCELTPPPPRASLLRLLLDPALAPTLVDRGAVGEPSSDDSGDDDSSIAVCRRFEPTTGGGRTSANRGAGSREDDSVVMRVGAKENGLGVWGGSLDERCFERWTILGAGAGGDGDLLSA